MSNARAPKSRIVEAVCRNDFLSFSLVFPFFGTWFAAEYELASRSHRLLS